MSAKNMLTDEYISSIEANAVERCFQPSANTLIMYWELPNGFVIIETADCIDFGNFDFDLGVSLCREKLRSKLWMLESYRYQCIRAEEGEVKEEGEINAEA